jgi:hypothetical protein
MLKCLNVQRSEGGARYGEESVPRVSLGTQFCWVISFVTTIPLKYSEENVKVGLGKQL